MWTNVRLAILVSALGYFVDVYDLILFTILRTASLKDLGVTILSPRPVTSTEGLRRDRPPRVPEAAGGTT